MAFTHSSTIAASEPDWGSVDKTALPRQAFADMGDPTLKSSWRYPHHWISGGTKKDEQGIWTDGTMYLHVGGWQAAINAAQGARSGQKASQSIQNHLESHRPAVTRQREKKAMLIPETAQCFSSHMGLWCIEPLWMQQAVTAIQSGLWDMKRLVMARDLPLEAAQRDEREYDIHEGVAIINLHGPMMKARSKFGGVGTVQIRQQLRQASKDPEVRTIMLHVDSPGGHVAGTQELADEIFRIRESGKQIIAHIDDLCASAAYWAASQVLSITANPIAEIGSIGTIAVLEDHSAAMEKQGITVHIITTGAFKGIGVRGVPVTDEALAYLQDRVESLNTHFLAAIGRGRKKKDQQLMPWSDGRVHIAQTAVDMGLIDKIMSFEDALAQASQGIRDTGRGGRLKAVHRTLRLQTFRQRQGV